MNNNKKNSILLFFEWSLPAQSEPNRITAMAIRGAPHFSQKIKNHQKLTRSHAGAWERARYARATTVAYHANIVQFSKLSAVGFQYFMADFPKFRRSLGRR